MTQFFTKISKRKTNILIAIFILTGIFLVSANVYNHLGNQFYTNTNGTESFQSNITPKASYSGESLFEGLESSLNITDYGNLYENDQIVTLDNTEELNLSYYVDAAHDWEISDISLDIKNIQDTRQWLNNSDFSAVTVYQENEVHESAHNYVQNRGRSQTLDTITGPSGAIAMRVHFTNLSFEEDYDYFFIEDENDVIYYTDTGLDKIDFFSPWIMGDTLQCYYVSDGTVQDYGYRIDYYEYVNGSSNYYENSYSWNFNSDAITETNYGPGNAEGSDGMFVALNSEVSPDGDYFDAVYYEGDYAEIYQDINIPRGSVVDAYISFDYYADFAMDSNENYIYCEIDNQRIYSKGIGDIVDAGRRTWHHTGKIYLGLWLNTSNVFENIQNDQDFNVSLGIMSGASITYSGFSDQFQQLFWFDNLTLSLQTVSNSSQNGIDLEINDNPLVEGLNWGESSLNLTGNWNSNPLILTVNTSSPDLTFELDTTLYGFHSAKSKIGQTTSEGVQYTILENGSIYWEFSHNFYMPNTYSDFKFVVDKPYNWIFTSVLDPTLQSILFEEGEYGDLTLTINETNAQFPGWWTFRAISPNYIDLSNTKLYKGGQWTNTVFDTGETTRIKTQVNYSSEIPLNLGATQVNLTVYDPEGLPWYEETKAPLTNGTVIFSEITFGPTNTTGGSYNYTLFWSNGTALGGIKSNFIVKHDSSLDLLKPNDATVDLITDAFVGDIIPLRVKLSDSENNDTISDAILSYNWTSGTEYLEEAAAGIYEGTLDTSDLGSNGFYEIFINSSKTGFYGDNLTLYLNLGEQTGLQRLQSDYNIEMHDNSTIKFKYYSLVGGAGIDGATVNVNISNPSYYSIANKVGGYYDIEFDTGFINELGIYQLNFNFSAPSFEPQTHIYQFEIIGQSVNLSVHVDNQVISENSILELNYMEQFNISAKAIAQIDGIELSGGSITWIVDSYSEALSEFTGNWFNTTIQINPQYYDLGINLVEIRFEQAKYQTTSFYIQLLISDQPVNLSVFIQNQEIEENSIIDITYMQYLNVSARAYAQIEMKYLEAADFKFIVDLDEYNFIEITPTWYNLSILIDPSLFVAGFNNIQIKFNMDNYTTKIFGFQLLVSEQPVNVETYVEHQAISENSIIEVMLMEEINISSQAYGIIESGYISGGNFTLFAGTQELSMKEYASTWYNVSIEILPSIFNAGLNFVYVQFEKGNYSTTSFGFQFLVVLPSVDLNVSINDNQISENELVEVVFKENMTISVQAISQSDKSLISGALISLESSLYNTIFTEYSGYWYNHSVIISSLNFSAGINSILISFTRENFTDAAFSFQLFIREQIVVLNVSVNNQSISENSLIEVMFKENITISAQAFATGEAIFLSGGNITILSEGYSKDLTESGTQPGWFETTLIIDGAYFNPGINSISVKFQQGNYTDAYFSFQLFVTAQNVNLSLSLNYEDINENSLIEVTFYDEIIISARAFADAEMIYLSGGTVSVSSNSYINYFTEEADFWYNTSIICNPDDFEIGINYVLIRFQHDNYSSATFSFQLLINQIEINTETVDFEDIKEVLPGEAITLLIQLTEAGSGYPIENATISYSWEFGIGEFTYLGSGIYGLNLTIPLNTRGNYRFNLIISTDVIDYKASQYSFIIDVGEVALPPFFLWIILAASAIAIAVLGALSLRSYVILPRKRKKEAELLKRTQRFKDMQNIQAIVVIHRQSGIPVYTKSFSILEHQKKELFSGFIQAITTIGEEIVGKKGTQEKSKKPTDVAIFEGLIELDFKYFYCLICDVEEIRLVAILREKASQRLKKQIANLSSAIKLELSDVFSTWDGNLDFFDKVVPPIISGHLELFYKEAFILANAEYIANIKKETEFSSMETRILNVIYSVAKNKTDFYLEPVIETVHEPNKDLVIDALEQLIEKKVIIPRKS